MPGKEGQKIKHAHVSRVLKRLAGGGPIDRQRMTVSYYPPLGGSVHFSFVWDRNASSIILKANSSTKSQVLVPKLPGLAVYQV